MRHEIRVEEYTRDADGKVLVQVTMSELAGAGMFRIVSLGQTVEEAMLELAHRLRLVADDADDIADKIFDQYRVENDEKANSSSQEGKEENGPNLRLLKCDGGAVGDEACPSDDGGD